MPHGVGQFLRLRLPLLAGAVVGALVVGGLMPQAIDDDRRHDGAGIAASSDPTSGSGARADSPGAAARGGSAGAPAATRPTNADDASETAATGDPTGAASTTATTSEVFRVGIVLFDIGPVSRVGVTVPNFSPEEQRAVYQVFVDDLNDRGGILGRRIEPVYRTYNVLDPDDMRAVCLRLTEDDGVELVIDPTGAFYGPPVVCVTEEHQTPFLSSGSTAFTDEMFQRSAGRLFTALQRGSRILTNQVQLLTQTRTLANDATVGVLYDTRPGSEQTVRAGLMDTLERSGYRIAVRAALAPDNATSASQMPVFVQRMRQAGVDTVFLAVGTLNATQFVQAAEQQMYRPKYHSSDWYAGSGDNWAQNMPATFEGSISVTATRTGEWRVDLPEPEPEQACHAIYETRSGVRVGRGDTAYGLAISICNLLGLVESGARAQQELDRVSLPEGISRLGAVQLANIAGGTFTSSKTDAADQVRMLRWEAECKCWKPASEFRQALV